MIIKEEEKNKKIKKGGEVVNDGQIINSDITYDIKPTDMIDKNILQLVIALVVLIILYTNDFLKTNSLSSFIQDQLLNPSNLNILRLMFFPIIIITIIIIIGGGKFFRSLLLRQMEKESIGNFDSNPESVNNREKN